MLKSHTIELHWLKQAWNHEKIVLAKGSSNHPGWNMHKMTCRDRSASSSQPTDFVPLKFYCIQIMPLFLDVYTYRLNITFDLRYKPSLKNIFVSPYPTLFHRYGSVGRKIIFFNFSNWILINLIVYSKTCLKRPLRKNCLFFQDRLLLNAGQSIAECSWEHSAIL